MLKSASWFTVAALIAGVIVGTMVGVWGSPAVKAATETFESVGVLWLNALRMTVIPLVFCLLVTGIASVADAAATGRLAVRAIIVFTVLLVVATAYVCVLMPAVLTVWPVDPTAAASFIAGATDKPVVPASPPTVGEWLAALAPSNPISAAAEGAVLPLTVFATFFGFAATRLPTAQREPMVNFFRAVADTMIIIVRWVLVAAPLGVFALSLGVGVRSGLGAAGVLLQYIVIACVVTFGIAVMAFLFAVIWGRVGAGRFLNASAPVLAVAFSTQSSLASLPIMVERSRDALDVPAPVANLVLPLAVAVFRMTSPVTNLVVVFFVAAVHGMHLDIGTIISGGIVAIAISVGSVGLPGQVSFIASVGPICLAMGVPIDVLGILLAVEVIPDIFRTVGNVMGDMAATVIANRSGKALTEAKAA